MSIGGWSGDQFFLSDYASILAGMKRTAAKAKIDPAYAMKLIVATGMYTKSGKLKKQFR